VTISVDSNGWYMNTEIGRNLAERYNVLPKIADKMGLDQKVNTSLWQDKAMLELNVAILHSYQKAGVTMVDHHTASKQFLMHDKREKGASHDTVSHTALHTTRSEHTAHFSVCRGGTRVSGAVVVDCAADELVPVSRVAPPDATL
jgi:nitric-oxide synthase